MVNFIRLSDIVQNYELISSEQHFLNTCYVTLTALYYVQKTASASLKLNYGAVIVFNNKTLLKSAKWYHGLERKLFYVH